MFGKREISEGDKSTGNIADDNSGDSTTNSLLPSSQNVNVNTAMSELNCFLTTFPLSATDFVNSASVFQTHLQCTVKSGMKKLEERLP